MVIRTRFRCPVAHSPGGTSRLLGGNEQVFPTTDHAVRMAWRRVIGRLRLPDFRFHDLRHEAVSRFFEAGLNVPEVALVSGHRDPRMLFRYTHPRPEDVADKLRDL